MLQLEIKWKHQHNPTASSAYILLNVYNSKNSSKNKIHISIYTS